MKLRIISLTVWICNVAIVNCYLSVYQLKNLATYMPSSLLYSSSKTIAELESMSTKEALMHICGELDDKQKLIPRISISKSAPTICQYIIANPVTFYQNPKIASLYGVDIENLPKSNPLTALASMLPVIYLADNHPEYGMLGFILNQKSGNIMNDNSLYSGLKNLRNRPIYQGGSQNRGASFTMVHRKAGFPENRIWKGLPGNTEFRLFFSPDIAMANELCSTKDALPTDFKFFQWSTIWQPRQLELEYDRKLWITINGPVEMIFEDDDDQCPLYKRIVASLGLMKQPSSDSSTTSTPMNTIPTAVTHSLSTNSDAAVAATSSKTIRSTTTTTVAIPASTPTETPKQEPKSTNKYYF